MTKIINKKKKTRHSSEDKVLAALPKVKGLTVEYEPHSIEYTIHGDYYPDLMFTLPSGHTFYVEVKGSFRIEHMRKMDAVITQHPDLDIRMVFTNKNKKNIRWCDKRNVKWAIGEVPEEWLHV